MFDILDVLDALGTFTGFIVVKLLSLVSDAEIILSICVISDIFKGRLSVGFFGIASFLLFNNIR